MQTLVNQLDNADQQGLAGKKSYLALVVVSQLINVPN